MGSLGSGYQFRATEFAYALDGATGQPWVWEAKRGLLEALEKGTIMLRLVKDSGDELVHPSALPMGTRVRVQSGRKEVLVAKNIKTRRGAWHVVTPPAPMKRDAVGHAMRRLGIEPDPDKQE